VALQDHYNFEELVNEAERIVLDELEQQLANDLDGIGENDILDMAAYALNNTPPRYRVNLLGRLYTRTTDESYQAQVESAVREAILKVRSKDKR
jgi:competence protein ComFB